MKSKQTKVRLSPIQEKVMKWANGGWPLIQEYGLTIFCNGQRICNLATINVLVKKGLLKQTGRWEWKKA